MAIAFTHAVLLDGTKDMKPQPDMTVVVSDAGSIVLVDHDALVPIPPNTKEIDLQGKYLMPGLINAHVHLCGTGKPVSAGNAGNLMNTLLKNPLARRYLRSRMIKAAQTQLYSGVTTVRSVGDPGYIDVEARDAINNGVAGPRLLVSGTGVTVPDGHGAGLFADIANTPEDARRIVRESHKHNVDLIKVFITGGVFDAEVEGEPGVLRMPLEIAAATVDEAHKLGLPTAAHIESPEGVRVGLQAGIDTIEHGATLDEETIALFKENGVGRQSALTCTLSPSLPYKVLDPKKTAATPIQQVNGDVVWRGIAQGACDALENGIPVALGTDSSCPFVTQYDFWREVVYFQMHTKVSNEFALYTATLKNAEILGIEDTTGSIEVGKSADMIILDENPLEDLKALRDVTGVVMKGSYIDNPHFKHLPKIDKELEIVMDETVRVAQEFEGVSL